MYDDYFNKFNKEIAFMGACINYKEECINKIQKRDLNELMAFHNPPKDVVYIFEVVYLLLFGESLGEKDDKWRKIAMKTWSNPAKFINNLL